MSLSEKLEEILSRYQMLEKKLSEQRNDQASFVKWSKEYSRLTPIVATISKIKNLQRQKEEVEILASDEDLKIRELAYQDFEELQKELLEQEHALKIFLLPKDEDDTRNAILEIRAGTGGEEATLFAANLLRMYTRYAENQGWNVEILDMHENDRGGIKEVGASISGIDVFAKLKFEAGVHRVQRVPETEASGRIHTSAATVAVLPEVEEVDIHIEEKDLRIDVYRSSGPGGQSVNTTDSAVRITHIPTGIVVQQQDEKSQHKNKAKALKILRARIYEHKRAQEEAKRSASRQSQVGSGDRSERIRTYNFTQGRVTDHRINLTLYKLDQILEGSGLEEVISGLITHDQAQRLAQTSQEEFLDESN